MEAMYGSISAMISADCAVVGIKYYLAVRRSWSWLGSFEGVCNVNARSWNHDPNHEADRVPKRLSERDSFLCEHSHMAWWCCGLGPYEFLMACAWHDTVPELSNLSLLSLRCCHLEKYILLFLVLIIVPSISRFLLNVFSPFDNFFISGI